MLIMSVFISALAGCGGGGGGVWNVPATPGAPGTTVVRPTVVATIPLTAATIPLVQPDTDITVTFNKDMSRASILATDVFIVTGPGAGRVTGAAIPVSYNITTKTATFNPLAAALAVGTYTATIKGIGANVATDTTGIALAGNSAQPTVANDYVWRFTVSLAAPALLPRVSSTTPLTTNPGPTLNVSTGTAVTATFNKIMDATSIKTGTFTLMSGLVPVPPAAIPVTYNAATRTVTFHPLAALDPGVTYTATIKGLGVDAAKDSLGNSLAGNPALPAVPNDYVWNFTTTNVAHLGPVAVNLGITEPYGVLAGTSITLGGSGVRVDGDVGISPGNTCNGCDANTVTGVIEVATPNALNAKIALVAAYDDAMLRVLNKCTINGTLTIDPPPLCGGISNGIFAPGLYWSGTTINIPVNGTITLDGQNDPTAVFIFQSESTINSLANSHVILVNGADAKNVFWVAKSSSTIGGTTADFKGTVIALSSITVNTGTNMLGRALARNGDITVQAGALITVPPN